MKHAPRSPQHAMCERWMREADGYEKTADAIGNYTKHEREILKMHARAKRACAKELLDEISKVRRG
jgi:hypothetical protein